jgi:DNA modification methylase
MASAGNIDKFTQEGDIILDPFAGSGTTLYVAKQNKRQFLGFEISGEYCKKIKKRLIMLPNQQ